MAITPTSTNAASTASVSSAAASSLLTALDTGSGIDTGALVKSLVEAQFATKSATLTARYDKLTAQISGVSTLKSTITTFSTALESLVKGGTLATQPISADDKVLKASALSGASLANFTASVAVTQLATAQTAVSATPFASAGATIGTGTLTLRLGTASYAGDGSIDTFTQGSAAAIAIDITDANSSLAGIAAAINAKRAGVTASVVTDADGTAYLALKGQTGTQQAFTLEATTETSGTLSRLNVGPGASAVTITGQAKNAKVTVDGAAVERASNSISDLIPGVKLDLVAVSTSAVGLSSNTPTDALSNAVSDFVGAYNEVFAQIKTATDPVTGDLRADNATQALLRSLQGLTLKTLVTGGVAGAPATLAEIGVGTNRDGTLTVDSATLAAALKNNPQAVEAIFAYSSGTTGLYGELNTLALAATNQTYGLGAASTRYTTAQGDITAEQAKIAEQSATLSTKLTQQFSTMNAKVAAYKSTQAFLKQQVDAWNNTNN